MAHMATQFDVYISCVKADRERVQQVREIIEKQGYSCWCHALAFHSLPVRFACVEAPPRRRSVHFRKILWSSDVFRLPSAAATQIPCSCSLKHAGCDLCTQVGC